MIMMMLRPSSKRRLAAAMLFVWIFALAAGIANGCAIGGVDGGVPVVASFPHHHDVSMVGRDPGHHAATDTVPSPDPQGPVCQKFCDDERATLNLPLKDLGGAADLLPVLLQQPTTLAWTSGEESAVESSHGAAPVRVTGPPVAIRFLRLTI